MDRLEPNGNIPANKSDLGYGKRKYNPHHCLLFLSFSVFFPAVLQAFSQCHCLVVVLYDTQYRTHTIANIKCFDIVIMLCISVCISHHLGMVCVCFYQ